MKQFKGTVVSTKMDETVVVLVTRIWKHPIYKKRVKRHKKYLVADSLGAKEGDKVIIQETRPISKRKRFKIVKIEK